MFGCVVVVVVAVVFFTKERKKCVFLTYRLKTIWSHCRTMLPSVVCCSTLQRLLGHNDTPTQTTAVNAAPGKAAYRTQRPTSFSILPNFTFLFPG